MADDPYVYPDSAVLRNLAGIRDANRLREFESLATFKRILQLEYSPLKGTFDISHVQSIHQHIFQDVYSWAGVFRTVDLGKENHWFCRVEFIRKSLTDLLEKLKDENYLRAPDLESFTRRAGYYLGELNAIHPFREGNGRVQREFIREMGLQAGLGINWSNVSREEMYSASEISFNTGNSKPLVQILVAITSKL